MTWNWQQNDWPNFSYDKSLLADYENRFLHQSGMFYGTYQHVKESEKQELTVSFLTAEALKTSEIEGEILNRDSVQSSIRRQLGLQENNRKVLPAENGISELMLELYRKFEAELTPNILFNWHKILMADRTDLGSIGTYRTHETPMQVVSGPIGHYKAHFEAPPSSMVPKEMNRFIDWFNNSAPAQEAQLSTLTRAGIAHLYFVSIHPFEDGNGRIGRAISDKVLSQGLNHHSLIALSTIIEKNRKTYYDKLEGSNNNNDINAWLNYFSETILEALEYSQKLVNFIIDKTRFYDKFQAKLNERQAKVIERIFRAGLDGFLGGLSAENYIKITSTSRATATRDLQELVAMGAFLKSGELKGTRYRLF